MSGWAIPEEKAGEIVQELLNIRVEFQKEKEAFLADYDQNVQAWRIRRRNVPAAYSLVR